MMVAIDDVGDEEGVEKRLRIEGGKQEVEE